MPSLRFIARYEQCPLCGETTLVPDFTYDWEGVRLTWDRCVSCDLVFQNPRLSEESIRAGYASTNYFGGADAGSLSAYSNYTRSDPIRIAQSKKRLARVQRVSGVAAGRLLDVGIASGSSGVAAQAAGFDVTCVEPDPELAGFASEQYGLKVLQQTIDDCHFEPGSYDIATLWGTDSHFLHPLHGFEILANALRDGGMLAMTYQDFSHPIRWIFPKLKTSWNVMYNFSDRSFDVLMAKLGLTVLYRGLEFQSVTLDHFCRVLRLRLPPKVLRHWTMTVPAVSFRFVVARKEPRNKAADSAFAVPCARFSTL
jgi:methyltransferase family protein